MENNGYKWYEDFLSRKFIVLAFATVLLWFGKVTDDVWLYVALAFIGTNIVQKYIENRSSTRERRDVIRQDITVAPGEKP